MIKKILIVFGTRPEAIKMAPVVNVLKNDFEVTVCVTAQHREMLDQVLEVFAIKPDLDLDIMQPGQDLFDITSKILLAMKNIISEKKPDLILVHGDTTTAMTGALAAFYSGIRIGHVEAGLRTNNINSPFPEEFNRQTISKLANFHFAPTDLSKKNLLNEGVNEKKIYITGNTVIDALFFAQNKTEDPSVSEDLLRKLPFIKDFDEKKEKLILITGHRRENFGQGFMNICEALRSASIRHNNVHFVYPVHLNPNVQGPVNEMLGNLENIHLISPLDYLPFVKLMELSYFILTDSGGIQEEAPSLGKPVLVMREETERPEAVKAGTVKIVGTKSQDIYSHVDELLTNPSSYQEMSEAHNPYGDGESSSRILSALLEVNK